MPKGNLALAIKRENWKDGYHTVAREHGRFVASSKWKGKQSSEAIAKKISTKYLSHDSSLRYAFVVTRDKKSPPVILYSSKALNIPRDSDIADELYRMALAGHQKYNSSVTIGDLKLVSTYDNLLGDKIH